MYLWTWTFLLGILSLNLFKSWPLAIPWVSGALFLAVISRIPFILAYALGFLWITWQAYSYTDATFPENPVSGYVVSIPEQSEKYTRFEFRPLKSRYKFRLAWNAAPKDLRQGDFLKLTLKLKNPHSYLNKNSFDYERWLYQQGIRGTGYVLPKTPYERTSSSSGIREVLQKYIYQTLNGRSLSGMISGLTVGIRSHITPEQWQVMQATGTNHLMAISGLHVGFVSGLIFFITGWLWRRSRRLPLWVPTPQVAAVASFIAAVLYGALAGFSIPTQRAVIMVGAFLITLCFRRHVSPWHGWHLALLTILIWDPLATLSNGFWLSFVAVGILYAARGANLLRTQWVVMLGLAPLTLLLFGQVSLIGLIANLIAIPWVGFLVLPLCFIGLFGLAETMLSGLWHILEWLADLPYGQFYLPITNIGVFISTAAGTLLLLAPKGIPGRWLGIIGLLPLFFWSPTTPKSGELWLTVLDVGQGLASVIRTLNHTLIYDTGGFDMGKTVLLPFLKTEGVKKIDRLVLSHPHVDHIGGAQSLLKDTPVQSISTSTPALFSTYNTSLCQEGQYWVWDGVLFEFLYPPITSIKKRTNDNSCVLRITHGPHRILLPGDIEGAGERYLFSQEKKLKSNILIVPHHGSRTSSTPAFVKAVQPHYAVFPIGYQNRYRHPHQIVLDRYKAIKANLYFTSKSGAISFVIDKNLPIQAPEQYRVDKGYYWHNLLQYPKRSYLLEKKKQNKKWLTDTSCDENR